jgi:hypothetical protein
MYGTGDEMSDARIFHITSKLGIAFADVSINDIGRLAGRLEQAGIKHTISQSRVDGSIFIELDPINTPDGIPVSDQFVRLIGAMGGRFSGGNGMASLLNRLNRGPKPASP